MSKKVLRSLALVMLIVMAFSVSSAAVGFKSSVDVKGGPEYIVPDGFNYEIIITPYAGIEDQKDERVQAGLEQLKNAYAELKDKALGDIVDKAALDTAAGVDSSKLVVSDIFDLWTNSPETIALTFKNIVAKEGGKAVALYRDYNGAWKILDTVVNADGSIDVAGLVSGSVAFLVEGESGGKDPETGDANANSWIWFLVAGVAVVGITVLAVCLVRSKKQENN
ncbi:MAG: hypothetical protein PUA50_02100 [Eubacteriales bacterium]|nr:hypothetical protein [Eubacteriales bacterium]